MKSLSGINFSFSISGEGSSPPTGAARLIERGDILIRNSNLTAAIRIVLLVVTLVLTLPALAGSDALMELVKILRDKGSLTQDEYELLVRAAKADEEKVDRAKHDVGEAFEENAAVVEEKTKKSSWAEKIAFKGDLRTRYQY